VTADAARIERFVDEQASSAARGIAIFASAQHGLFETLEVATPFENEVTARATPSLFQLARLADDRETAVVAVVALNVARLFIMQRGLLREVEGLSEDPKGYHAIRGTNAMNQKHYQRHAEVTRAEFAREVADMVERLVDREGAGQVVLAGEQEAIARLRQALAPRVARLVHERAPRMDVRTPRDAVGEEIEPLLREAEADEDRTVVQRLVAGVQAGDLGVAGLEATRAALRAGQADALVLSGTASFPPEARSALIDLAVRSGASVEIVDGDETLDRMGGVGALLRYRLPTVAGVYASPTA